MTGQRKPKPKVDVHKLVSRLSAESKTLLEREIIAPLLPGGRIRTRLGGMIYEFKPKGEFAGWGHFRPINEREAELLSEALPWERGAYLEQFPALRMILLWLIPLLAGQERGGPRPLTRVMPTSVSLSARSRCPSSSATPPVEQSVSNACWCAWMAMYSGLTARTRSPTLRTLNG